VANPNFWPDVVRVINIVLTAVCTGAYGYTFFLYYRNRRAQLLEGGPVSLLLTFSLSYLLLLLSGVVIDIARIHQPLSPIHAHSSCGVSVGLVSLILTIRIAIRLWRKGRKL
jgi:hypothetical protein